MNRFTRTVSPLLMIASLSLSLVLHWSVPGQTNPPRTPPLDGQVVGTAGKGTCPNSDFPLVALVLPTPEGVVGKMTAANPYVWFYIPYDNKVKAKLEFTLQDQNHNSISKLVEDEIELPEKPGFIKVSIASDPDLEKMQDKQYYQWKLTLVCGFRKEVSGWIQWTQADAAMRGKLAMAKNDQQKAEIYYQQDIWYDTINLLAQQRQQPAGGKLNWEQFLLENWAPAAATATKSDAKDREVLRNQLNGVIKEPIVN